jgi:CubicO group peptidase (beta-lactamase class C family)
MNNISTEVHGTVGPGFEIVRDAFAETFKLEAAYRNVGSSLAIYREGKQVVDLWGGHADGARTRPWYRDTLANVFSATKGAVALAAAHLVEKGKLDYGRKVAGYWPQFTGDGKDATTVAELLSHHAGLPSFQKTVTVDDLYDWSERCNDLLRQAPCWTPGERPSYHAVTWGYVVGELLSRAADEPIASYLRRHIAGPLAADVFIGLPQSLESRAAELLRPKMPPPDLNPLSPCAARALDNPAIPPETANTTRWRDAKIPSANGHASAQGLARLWGAIANGGTLDGVALWSQSTIDKMTKLYSAKIDELYGTRATYGMGISWYLGTKAFGHFGWGGSFGICMPEKKVGIGFVLNQMSADPPNDPRFQKLFRAIFTALYTGAKAFDEVEFKQERHLQAGPLVWS